MAVRISSETTSAQTTVKVDGWLTDEEIPVLLSACQACSNALVLDLADLRFASRGAVVALRELRAGGAALIRLRPYLALLLDDGVEDR